MPVPTEEEKQRMKLLHATSAKQRTDLDAQVSDILARPGSRTSMGMLDPRAVSLEDARLIAQQRALQPQQPTRWQQMGPRLPEALGALGRAGPATAAQLIPGDFEIGKQFQELQKQYGPMEAFRRWGEEGRPTIPSFDIPTGFREFLARGISGGTQGAVSQEVAEGFIPEQLGLKGALEMFAQPDIVAPVLGAAGKLFRSGKALSAAARKGSLLQAATPEELGKGYQVKDALKVARDLEDQVTSTGNIIMSRAKDAKRDLGRMDNHGHMLDVPNQPSVYDVAENPTAYIGVTERQQEGIRKLTDIVADVRKEREIFGRSPDEITLLEEGRFLPRTVLKTATVEDVGRTGGAGRGLRGGGTERSRIVGVGEVAEAEARGAVYADPLKSVSDYSQRWLQDAADTHIRDLLVPFSQTSSMRVDPVLRANMQALRQQAQSLLQSGIRLSDDQNGSIRAFLMSDDPDIDVFRSAISRIRITRGQFKGQSFDQAKKTLADIRKEAVRLAPEWRKALQASKAIPAGRARVPGDNTPMLMGRDFTEDAARRISRHYWSRGPTWNRNKVFSKILTGSRSVRFLNATFDISALLRQQASAAVAHPATYIRNVFKSFRDVVDSRAYDELLASPEGQRAASRGVAIFGDVGEAAEFQATSWLDWLPITKQANNHFIRFNTRQRVDLFDLERNRLIAKLGRETTAAEEDAIARAINRATGVSKSRAGEGYGGVGLMGEFENQGLFAARYTRSTIEEVLKAASDRSIEGEIARRYIGHLVAVTAFLATATAVAQKRDPSEVLNPFDMRAMDKGRLMLNPNFLSVSLFGHDVKPLGPFDSLARLMFVATDSTHQAWTTWDYKKLGDFIGYGSGTKGSPLVSFGVDLIRGRTFTGEGTFALPRSLSELGTAGRVLPFTLQTVSEDVSRGMSIGDVVGGAVLESVGEKTSPMSFSDYTDEFAREQFGARYRDVEPFQRDVIRDNIEAAIESGRVPRRQASDPYWTELDTINKDLDAAMETLIGLIKSRQVDKSIIIGIYFDAISENRTRKDQAARDYGMEEFEADPNETDPNKLALQGYYDLFDKAEVRIGEEGKGVFISEVFNTLRSAYERSLPEDQLQYVYRNTNMRDIPTEILRQLPASTRNRVLNSMRARRALGQRQEGKTPELGGVR